MAEPVQQKYRKNLTMAVISEEEMDNDEEEWILVKRPFIWEAEPLRKFKANVDKAHEWSCAPYQINAKTPITKGYWHVSLSLRIYPISG